MDAAYKKKIYSLGDTVWHAHHIRAQRTITCPECFGKKYLTVILGDDSKVTIDCAGCASGYDPPKGYVNYYEYSPEVRQVIISKVEITKDHVEYGYDGTNGSHWIAKDTELFSTKEEAEIKAKELAEEWNKEQLARIHRKEKKDHTWAWHVHYYRKQIRDAKKTIEHAQKKLDAAREHSKEAT
jgi:hypothetical protein